MHIALYRKYRPKTFDEVAGQDAVTRSLKNEIAFGRIGHAYLLTGSKGTGKTSCAKIIAKAVNCLEPREGNPCGQCGICVGIEEESILDVVEIDAASNNGVDSIRQLREEANFTPVRAKYRVYIIDEVHMLSTGAFNALLKIMEEPPDHVIFILATTEAHKVPPTVLSRCQRFNFRRIAPDVMAQVLLKTAKAEGLQLEESAAHAIANLAEGALRDALSLLDVCVSHNEPITEALVAKAAGLASQTYLFELSQCVLQNDAAGALRIAKEAYDASVEPERLCEQLILHYRNLMLIKTAPDESDLLSCMPADVALYKQQGAETGMALILYCLNTLQETMNRLARTANKRVELEMCLLRLCNPTLGAAPEAVTARIEKLEMALRSGTIAQPEQRVSEWTSRPVKTEDAPEMPPVKLTAQDFSPAPKGEAPAHSAQRKLFSQWSDVLLRLKESNAALQGMLNGSKAYEQGAILLIESDQPMLGMLLKSSDFTKSSLNKAIADTCGKQYSVRVLGSEPEADSAEEAPQPDALALFAKRAQDAGISVDKK